MPGDIDIYIVHLCLKAIRANKGAPLERKYLVPLFSHFPERSRLLSHYIFASFVTHLVRLHKQGIPMPELDATEC